MMMTGTETGKKRYDERFLLAMLAGVRTRPYPSGRMHTPGRRSASLRSRSNRRKALRRR